ncbi:hypothetical protein BD779DRAFT_1673591 [Infundibulicybe gibba]|nr:hypothetical protein BD779DRAFT_1673591 [Infundibulicybe gibba]
MPTHLPPELVCKIFLHAAQSSSSSCRTLCEVSTWARHLALPHLYATISLNTCDTLAQFLLSVITPSCSPRAHRVPSCRGGAECLGYSHLGKVQDPRPTLPEHIPYRLRWLQFYLACRRRRLSATRPEGCGQRADLDVLMLHNGTQHDWTTFCYAQYRNINTAARITHLRLGDPVKFETQLRVGHMRRLTHLAVPCGTRMWRSRAHITFSEEYMTKDQCREVEDWVRLTRKTEERIYMVRPLYDQLRDEWNAEARGGATVWERASQYTRSLSPV